MLEQHKPDPAPKASCTYREFKVISDFLAVKVMRGLPAAWCLMASRLATHSEEGASTTIE